MTPRWFEVPVADIALHADSARLAALLRWNSSRTSSHLGEWSIFTAAQGGGVRRFDGTTAKLRTTRGTGKYKPEAARVPWDPSWRPPSSDGGNHDSNCYVDGSHGTRWGVWMPSFPAKALGGLITLPGTLGCGNAWLIREPAIGRKGRVVRGQPADLRTYRGNDPMCNGAGVIPRPVTQAQLDAGRITHALSCYVSSETFGVEGLVVAPAGKVENGSKGPSVGGVRWSWRFDDADLDGCFDDLEPRHRAGLIVVCNALREFGCTVDMTGPNAGIVCADVDLPRDGLARVLDRVEWVVHEPPVGYRSGEAVDGIGHCDDFRYG